MARAHELKPDFDERVITPVAERGKADAADSGTYLLASCEWVSGVKSKKRSLEKTMLNYDGDARYLKDALRASVICDTWAELLRCVDAIFELAETGVIVVEQVLLLHL